MASFMRTFIFSIAFLSFTPVFIEAKHASGFSQIAAGVALGTGTGLTLGLLNKHYPQYNPTSSLITSIAHSALLTDLHKEMNAPGIALDLSSFLTALAVYFYINKSTIWSNASITAQNA